jgi:poly-beta-1,6-N-acetyl-D-glucosamine synthase
MWILIFLFGLATLLLSWTLFGYFIVTWFMGLFRGDPAPPRPAEWPFMTVIVPCYNEEGQILVKLNNIRSLYYPADRLEVIFVDGGSADLTVDCLEGALREEEPYRVMISPRGGKINQLNHAMSSARGEIIVNTDADALLDRDALEAIAAEFAADPNVALVGACCQPDANALPIDQYYWDEQNRARLMESRAGCASIVVAPCYAFRRDLLAAFPEDVVADDVYMAFLAAGWRRRVVYSRRSLAVETRNPRTLTEFLPHKFRKANAFLRESLRFVYKLPDMPTFVKILFLTRLAQQLLFPWAVIAWVFLAGVLVTLQPDPRYDVAAAGAALLFLCLVMTSAAFRSVPLPGERKRHSLATVVKGYVLTTLILLASGVSYPFYRQTSVYGRLGKKTEKK